MYFYQSHQFLTNLALCSNHFMFLKSIRIARSADRCNGCVSVRLSVCLFRCFVQMNKDMIVRSSALGRTIILVLCKIGGKLVLITNRKSHMSFCLLSKSVTLNYLEQRNGHYFVLFSSDSVDFGAHYVQETHQEMR